MNGYNTSNESSILGTSNLYYNSLTDGIVTMGGGDITGGNLISTKSLYVNGVNITGTGGGLQGPQGVHGTNVIFTTPSIVQLDPTSIFNYGSSGQGPGSFSSSGSSGSTGGIGPAKSYVVDSITSTIDSSGVITNIHSLTFGILRGDTGPRGIQGVGLTGDMGPRGFPGFQGPQGVKGDKGDSGSSASDILGTLVDLGLAAGEAALGATVIELHTNVGLLQGEVSTLTADVTTLQAKTLNMTHNPVNNKTNFSVNKLAIDNGISDKITLSNDGTISSTDVNVDNLITVPEIEVTNINPHTVLGGIVGTGINIGASYIGTNVNMINIGNPIANVNLVGLISCNGRLISDPLHISEFVNQF